MEKIVYIIQEKYVGTGYGNDEGEWYDDRNHLIHSTLEEAKHDWAQDRKDNPAHYEYYNHRIIARKENVVQKEDNCSTWKPIETFDGSMFSLMSSGIPDCTEVVKYKGEVPEWAKWWMPLPSVLRG